MSARVEDILAKFEGLFLDKTPLLRTPRTIQILLVRQTHDFAIFRTEESRELNTAVTPRNVHDSAQFTRIAFLASKQKAPETRLYSALVKEYFNRFEIATRLEKERLSVSKQMIEAIEACELKDRLCRSCPRCVLFGAVTTEKGQGARWNIKHRIEYSTAFSLEPYQLVSEHLTFNAITESTQSTEQALGVSEQVSPAVNFPCIITINSPTKEEFIMVVKMLLASKSYGAEGRLKGDVVNYVTGIVGGLEEIITPLEYCLELAADTSEVSITEKTYRILREYSELAAFREAVVLPVANDTQALIDYIQRMPVDKEMTFRLYRNSIDFATRVGQVATKTAT